MNVTLIYLFLKDFLNSINFSCAFACVCMSVYILCVYVCVCMCMNLSICVSVYMDAFVCVDMCICVLCVHVFFCVCVRIGVYMCRGQRTTSQSVPAFHFVESRTLLCSAIAQPTSD